MRKSKVAGKIIVKGILECTTPLHIGSGQDDITDMDILVDENRCAFIPASSFIGVLRHAIAIDDPDREALLENFWGFTRDRAARQSAIRCDDLTPVNGHGPDIGMRDGIRMENATGMVKEGGLFQYEIVERGACFRLDMELTFTADTRKFVEKMAATILSLLRNSELRLGAKTNSGLGNVSWRREDEKVYLFDFTKKEHVISWLKGRFPGTVIFDEGSWPEPFNLFRDRFRAELTLELKTSLIIRSYSEDPSMPDAVCIESGGVPVLTGPSLKGAMRARAEKILATLGVDSSFSENLFGFVDDENPDAGRAKKGRLRVHECLLSGYPSEKQTRIRIDRFTGGTIETALFETMPVFSDQETRSFTVVAEIEKCAPAEAGLMLLVIKDLWCGDLALGGEKSVGRGVCKGIRARIEHNGQTTVIEERFDNLSEQEKARLQGLVGALAAG